MVHKCYWRKCSTKISNLLVIDGFFAATTETSSVDEPKWRDSCPKELAAIVENKTFLLLELTADNRAVGCR